MPIPNIILNALDLPEQKLASQLNLFIYFVFAANCIANYNFIIIFTTFQISLLCYPVT